MLDNNTESLALVDDLQRRYVEALDHRDLNARLDCF